MLDLIESRLGFVFSSVGMLMRWLPLALSLSIASTTAYADAVSSTVASPAAVSGTVPSPAVSAINGTIPATNLLSPISLFNHADWVVKSVIVVLLFASLLSWSVWLGKMWQISTRARKLKESLGILHGVNSLSQTGNINHPACQAMSAIVQNEIQQAATKNYLVPVDSIKERASTLIERIESAETRHLTRGASILATTGAVAPFVGLFGTVWGIMHSFASIAETQTTNLAIVAPGIAEALFATALGLIAAIPAVILYNTVSRYISGYRVLLSDSSSLVMCLLSHALDELNINPKKFSNVA